MRIVFMGTPEFGVPAIEWLIQSEHQVVAVYTQPEKPTGRGRRLVSSPVKRVAQQYGLPVLQPATLRRSAAINQLANLIPDAIITAAFGQILPQEVLNIPAFGCLNVHPSLLPRHRGASPIAATILAGDEQTGVTIMVMDAGMDTGPILAQSSIPIEPKDTTQSLTAKLAEAGARLLEETLPLWLKGQLTPQPQDNDRATYSHPFSKAEGKIDWNLTAVEIWRRVRAFYPWPACYTQWRGKRLKILEATPLPEKRNIEPGRVIALDYQRGLPVGVQTGDGILGLRRVQLEGKRDMPAAEFVRGQRGFVGAPLE